ncbi:MAG TPA: amidohydrolase family protein [Spongiibacteraceae bacterium]
MSTQKRRLFSVDSHLVVTDDQVKKNLASSLHSAWDTGISKYNKHMADDLMGGQKLAPEDFVDMEAATHPGYYNSTERLKVMDADGVECEVMYSEFDFTSKVYSIGDKWRECATAYNNTLYEFASVDPKRILITYQLPLIDIDYAVSEIYRLRDLGARSIQIPNFPAELGMPDYHNKQYDKLWTAFSETGVVVANHLTLKQDMWGVFRRDPTPQKGIYTSLPGFALAETMAWYILTGILERFPKLKIVFVEPGLFWVPGYIRFLDERMHHHYNFPGVKELPSTYFKRQMAATFVNEPGAREFIDFFGANSIMWSTDFPHPCCNWPNAGALVEKQFADFTPEEKQKITWDNGARMYGIS